MTKRIALTATIFAALALAVPAFAGITVYSNDFKSKDDYRSVTKQSGKKKKCKRQWRKKSALGVTVKSGKQNCALKTPVEGDSSQPDLIVRAEAKITAKTEKAARKGAYVGVSVRSGRKDGYVFRVIPKTRKWELVEKKVVLEKGKDNAVKGIKKRNALEIRAKGDTIVGKVNGKSMVSYKDPAPEDVKSTGTGLVYGIKQKVKKKEAVAFFDKLKVQVPNP
ncbi:MAG TPA: hypothetical protein VNM42_03970 [Solirubrobacterales bacterium]|jgi:hypothetical protein|nr:hypothetical protein [Solirubrobacterales bacterium]